MGFYIRKSIKVGAFRFNLSKSGIGLSVGVKGFRVGSGPNGNYIHMGRNGLYYRKTLNTFNSHYPKSPGKKESGSDGLQPMMDNIAEQFKEIESAEVKDIIDSDSKEIIDEINQKLKKLKYFPFALILSSIIIYTLLVITSNAWIILSSIILLLILLFISYQKDILNKTTVLYYNLENEYENNYQNLLNAFRELKECKSTWHIEAKAGVKDWKRNAGASELVRRNKINLGLSNPKFIKTNIATPSIPVGKQTIFLFPDRLLIIDKNMAGGSTYKNVKIDLNNIRFIESEFLPQDTTVVDYTWRYVNKSGGPDRRFKDNKRLPIALYTDLYFTSESGLNEKIELSKANVGYDFISAINNLAKNEIVS